MFPFPPQPLTLGHAPLGYPPNIQPQLFLQQPGLTQSDFPPLPSPFLPQHTPVPPQSPGHQTFTPHVNPPHLQRDTSYAPNSQHDSDVDFCTDTSDVESGKETTDGGKVTRKEHRHGWQHVKKRKRIHPHTESSTHLPSAIRTQNRYTLLLNGQENGESPQTSTHRDTPNIPKPPPIFVYGVKEMDTTLSYV
jgi:hypothetical protein